MRVPVKGIAAILARKKSLAGILLREHDTAEQAFRYAERMAQRYADSRSTMAMEYQDAAQELKAWMQNKHR